MCAHSEGQGVRVSHGQMCTTNRRRLAQAVRPAVGRLAAIPGTYLWKKDVRGGGIRVGRARGITAGGQQITLDGFMTSHLALYEL